MLSPLNPAMSQFAGSNLAPDATQTGRSKAVLQPQAQGVAKGEPMPSAGDRAMTPDRAAGNILLFIENRLHADAAAGMSTEQLQSRLDAGLEGFLQGFNEAKQILSDSGLLSDDLLAAISATYDKVLAGMASVAQELGLDDSAIVAAQSPESPPEIEAPDAVAAPIVETQGLIKASRQFDFSVTTQEGDRVSISASSFFKGKYSADASGMSAHLRQGNAFELRVEGDLNADELTAINDLLGQVNDLADEFYNGDLGAAFESAMALNFDADEISGFALDMKQTLMQKVQTTYGQPSLNAPLQPLGQMAEQVQAALESAREFLEPRALLYALLERMSESELINQPEGAKADLHKLFMETADALAGKLID